MAEYKVTYTSDGKVEKKLTYKNTDFSYTMIPNEHGKTGDKKGFEYQVADQFPDEDENVLEALDELGFADEDGIEDILTVLSEYE